MKIDRVILVVLLLAIATHVRAESWPPRLARAVEEGTLKDQVEPLANELREAIGSKETPDDRLIDLASWYRYAAFFSRIETKDELDKKCLVWLARQPKLMRTVSLAVGRTERPDAVLAVVRALYRTDRETLEEWPDLVAALVVVWDEPRRDSSDDPAARGDWAVQLYDYLKRNNNRLRYDLKTIPWQLQTYIVDLVVSREEIVWAWDRYGRRGDVGGIYFDVPYDTAAYYQGTEKKIDALAYTLENLNKHGGICTDQAYYATQVGRLLGVPTVTITGQGGAGEVGHAWVGYLARQGKKVVWDLSSGRYREQLYWTGQVDDPQSRQPISESETSLLGELQNTTPSQRMRALAIMRSLELFEQAEQVKLVIQALNLSPADRDAWLAIGDLGAAGALSNEQSEEVAEVVRRFASKQYADLAFLVYRKMISGRSNMEQLDQLDKLIKLFDQRPDIIATIRVEQGKLFKGLKQNDRAMAAWGDVLRNHLYAGPIVMEALQLTDDTLREEGKGRQLLAVYDKVFTSIPQPTPSALAAYTPFCRIGVKYADLLDEAGDRTGAMKVRQRVAVYDKSIQITIPSR